MTLSVLIPVFNEEQNITPLYLELIDTFRSADILTEIIFINDASTDSTLKVLDKLAQTDQRVKIIDLKKNQGQSYATMQGINAAQGNLLAILDGDMQNDPAELPKMIDELIGGYDLVCGWRKDRKDKRSLVISSRFANFIIRLLFHVDIHDSGCSQRVGYTANFKKIRYFEHFHRYIPIIAAMQKLKITEIEVNHRPRFAGQSKYTIMKSFRVVRELIYLRFFY